MPHLLISLLVFTLINATKTHAKVYDSKETKEFILVKGYKTPYPYINEEFNNFYDLNFIKENSLEHSEDLWGYVPNINTAGGTNKVKYIQIRGVGERSQYENTPDNSVGVFLDHIDLSGSLNLIDMNNISDISVFKGPQSFIYGSDALAGNIILKTKTADPLIKKTSLKILASNFKTKSINARFSSPISPSFSFNSSFLYLKSDGFIRNSFLNQNTNDRDELSLSFNTSYNRNNIDIKTSHFFAKQKNGYDLWAITPYTNETISDKPGSDDQEVQGQSLDINIRLNKSSTLSLISSITKTKSLYSYDEDWGNDPYWNSVPGYNADYNYNKSYERKNLKIHQKIILQQKLPSKILLTSGLHYSRQSEDSNILSFKDDNLRDNLNSRFKNEQGSLLLGFLRKFNKLSLNLNSRLQKDFLRYETSLPYENKSNELLYSFNTALKYTLNSRNLINFKISKGFKSGGFNPDLNLNSDRQAYESEKLYNYELSYYYQPLNLSLSLFYMDRKDQQVTTSFQDDPADPSSFTLYIDNAASSYNYGLEASIDVLSSKLIKSSFNLGLLRAKFKNYQSQGVDFSNRDQAHSPEFTFSLINKLNLNKKLSLILSIYGKDSFYFSNGHNQESKPYSLMDLNLNYKINQKANFLIWSKNLLNKNYAIRGFYFANEPPAWDDKLYLQNGQPLSYGITFNYDL